MKKAFTESQTAAINHSKGNAVVLAVAGAGKTTVMTHRAAKLASSDFLNPPGILMLTFTKKAAEEMASRVVALSTSSAKIEARTFHSWCFRVLKQFHKSFQNNDCMMDERDEWRLSAWADSLIKKLRLGREVKAADVIKKVDGIKSLGCFPGRIRSHTDPICSQLSEDQKDLYESWWALQSAHKKFDFSDLVTHTLELLRSNKEVRERVASHYQYVMVDEYQDTDPGQEMILELICNCPRPTVGAPIKGADIMVVGDDDQSIYAFRNAVPRFIIDFQLKWGAKPFFLEENFRSHSQILQVANNLIGKNVVRVKKSLKSVIGSEGEVTLVSSIDEGPEIIRYMSHLMTDGSKPRDFAVLYRTNAQSCLLESTFTDAAIPYVCEGNQREGFYGIPEVKTLLNYLRVIHDRSDFEALQYIWNRPTRYLRREDLVTAKKNANSDSALDILEAAEEEAGKNKWRVSQLRNILENGMRSDTPVNTRLETLIAALEYDHWLRSIAENGRRDFDDLSACVDQMVNDGRRHPKLSGFINHADLMIENAKKQDRGDAVRLMTLHRSKGLEFPNVFFVGFNSDYVPHPKGEVEEERRLAYVGITRAIKNLVIISKPGKESKFLNDLGLQETKC